MRKTFAHIGLLLFISTFCFAQNRDYDAMKEKLNRSLTPIYRTELGTGKVSVDSISVNDKRKTAEFHTNLSLSYLPMRKEIVFQIYDSIRAALPHSQRKYRLSVFSDGKEISTLVPNHYRNKGKDKSRTIAHKVKIPVKTNISEPVHQFSKGLTNNHIALWQSHGWYYEQKLARWEWQRARIFQTVEDLYTQSYVLPFLAPMLENSGANVFMPRERDYNNIEVILDNDEVNYREINGVENWKDSDKPGFSNPKSYYLDGENPFGMGTARQTKTIAKDEESFAEWKITVPKKERYGVYVAYQSFKNSTEDALYSVYHSGGKTDFTINQKMGGGTWIFLGQFTFDNENENHKITLSNKSSKKGRIVSADAVKIGGGMGNIARMPHPDGFDAENTKSSETQSDKKNIASPIKYKPEVSGYPRYTEGARYWMQWAGVPDSIYNPNKSKNDYIDDYVSRGHWVNYLAGGSSVLPKTEGLNIPLDLAMAFHTDAGTTLNDSIIGTLGIYMTHHNNELFENGKSRWASRELTDLIMEEIVNDIRRHFEPDWTRRAMWNRSYAEARTPNVPTMLLELLSHQNFADMRYGLDPEFRFSVSRAIYKGMLKFLASQYDRDFVVQPLPVKDFNIAFSGESTIQLSWQPVVDVSEPTATPKQYIVHIRTDDGDFDNGFLVNSNQARIDIEKDKIYSFKIVAVNEGGKSFPSEILSVCRKSEEKGTALIVNGFERVSAPFSFIASDSIAGFFGDEDHGVPYLSEHHFIGPMREFRRSIPWMDDDASGFGDSSAEYETITIAGNSFDYPFLHGKGFAQAGYSFVSASASSIENESVNLSDYQVVDWILGKQREWTVARGAKPSKFKTFSKMQQQKITGYCNNGGNIIVSGAFVGTDFWDNKYADQADRDWAQQTLKFKWRNNRGAVTGEIKSVASPFESISGNYEYYNELNSESYVVENPDAIEPADKQSFTIFRYSENNLSAGVFHKSDKYASCVLGFPIESIKTDEKRNELMKNILDEIAK